LIERLSKKVEQKNASSETPVIQQPFEVLNRYHPAAQILQNSALVVARQLEMLNVFLVIILLINSKFSFAFFFKTSILIFCNIKKN